MSQSQHGHFSVSAYKLMVANVRFRAKKRNVLKGSFSEVHRPLIFAIAKRRLPARTFRSVDFCERRLCRITCRSRPVNRNSVTSHNLPFPSAVNLLRLSFNARRGFLRHCIPLEFSRIVPSLSRFCCHLSPRYGILPP